jgi:hypothetical protein
LLLRGIFHNLLNVTVVPHVIKYEKRIYNENKGIRGGYTHAINEFTKITKDSLALLGHIVVDQPGDYEGDGPELEVVTKHCESFNDASLLVALAVTLAVVAHAPGVHATGSNLVAKAIGAFLKLVGVVSSTLLHVALVVCDASHVTGGWSFRHTGS